MSIDEHVITKDFMKLVNNNNKKKDSKNNLGMNNLTNNNDQNMAKTICLFRKYLLKRSSWVETSTNDNNNNNNNNNKNNIEEEAMIIKRRRSPLPPTRRPLILPKIGCTQSRHPSFLEQRLLSDVGGDAIQPASSSSDEKSSTAQLTIFYSGAINVYDNVPLDKAQAIMLLAGRSSFSSTTGTLAATKDPKTDVKKPIHPSKVPYVCKLQAEIPLARKRSLQQFLEKRRDRITKKSPYLPYASSSTKNKDKEEVNSDENQTFIPSPFPSRLGFYHVSTNK